VRWAIPSAALLKRRVRWALARLICGIYIAFLDFGFILFSTVPPEKHRDDVQQGGGKLNPSLPTRSWSHGQLGSTKGLKMSVDHVEPIVRAVIESKSRGQFLVAHAIGEDNLFLPGGHVHVGEGMVDALKRELIEELGFPAKIGTYLGALEHFWGNDHQLHHEINHYFSAFIPDAPKEGFLQSNEPHLEFFWLQASELKSRNLQPAPLQDLLLEWKNSPTLAWWASSLEAKHDQNPA